MVRLPVPERCVRHPPGWTFEVAEIVAGPLRSFDGLPFYVVMINIEGARPLRFNAYKVPLMRNLVKRAIRGAEAGTWTS